MAHRSSLSVVLTSSASAKCLAPTGPILLSVTLQTRRVQMCQRLLTLWAGHGPAAAYLSDLVTVLEPIRLAITTAEATPSCSFDRSMVSTGSVPFSCLISSGVPSTLRRQHHGSARVRGGVSVSGC